MLVLPTLEWVISGLWVSDPHKGLHKPKGLRPSGPSWQNMPKGAPSAVRVAHARRVAWDGGSLRMGMAMVGGVHVREVGAVRGDGLGKVDRESLTSSTWGFPTSRSHTAGGWSTTRASGMARQMDNRAW